MGSGGTKYRETSIASSWIEAWTKAACRETFSRDTNVCKGMDKMNPVAAYLAMRWDTDVENESRRSLNPIVWQKKKRKRRRTRFRETPP